MGTWALYFEVLFGMIGSLRHNFIYQLTRCHNPAYRNSQSSIREDQK